MVEEVWTCGSCGRESERVETGEQPEKWLRVEDEEYIEEYCSVSCASAGMLMERRNGLPKDNPGRNGELQVQA